MITKLTTSNKPVFRKRLRQLLWKHRKSFVWIIMRIIEIAEALFKN